MWGGDDPDCRKPLWWPEYQFNPENKNNIQDKEKEYVEVGFNEELYAYYKQMTDLRNKNIDVFAECSIEFVKAEGKLLAYLRKLNDTEVLVVLNAGEESVTYNLQPSKTYKDLIKGEKISRNELVLEALSGKVLLVE